MTAGPSARDAVRHLLAARKADKAALVARSGVGSDLAPLLVATVGDWQLDLTLPGESESWVDLLEGAFTGCGADLAVLCGEGYTARNVDGSFNELYANDFDRPLAAAFAAGDQRVFEALFFLGGDASESWCANVPYRYLGRSVTWGEEQWEAVHDPATTVDGNLPPAVFAALHGGDGDDLWRVLRRLREARVAFLARSRDGRRVTDADLPPARNAPCPCGAGRKAKTCHWG